MSGRAPERGVVRVWDYAVPVWRRGAVDIAKVQSFGMSITPFGKVEIGSASK